MLITSRQNPKVKHVVELHRRRKRNEHRQMVIEGALELSFALDSGLRFLQFFYCPAFFAPETPPDLLPRIQAASDEIYETDASVFEKLSYRESPDGWLAVLPTPERTLAELTIPPDAFFFVSETVEKPGNIGAMLRTLDAVGGTALLMCDPTTDITNPNLIRASRGACFTVPVVETTSTDAIGWFKQHSVPILATTPAATLSYTAADLTGPVAVVLGPEDVGLSDLWLHAATHQVVIPMRGRVNSLNVSIAAALLAYEALRQRTTP